VSQAGAYLRLIVTLPATKMTTILHGIRSSLVTLTTQRRLHNVVQCLGGVRRSVMSVSGVVGEDLLYPKGSLRSCLLQFASPGYLRGVTGVTG
jgi:hypothetical protein